MRLKAVEVQVTMYEVNGETFKTPHGAKHELVRRYATMFAQEIGLSGNNLHAFVSAVESKRDKALAVTNANLLADALSMEVHNVE